MAILNDTERAAVTAEVIRDLVAYGSQVSLTKANVRAAVNALDDWWEANVAAANTAIPTPARTSMSTRQKVRMFQLVLSKRYAVTA